MKQVVSLVLAIMMLLSLTACGAKEHAGGDRDYPQKTNTEARTEIQSYAVKPVDLKRAILKAGYEEQDYSDADANDLGINNAKSCTEMFFYKNENGVEKYTEIFFIEFVNESDAITAYNYMCNLCVNDEIPLQAVQSAHGLKSVHTDDVDPEFGGDTIISQVENTVVFVLEGWDIDSKGTYDHEINSILSALGY